ncbi:hypothetical protein [Aeromonas jandaei]|uniref:hypothetical protein n=1 Tax=Aeromonas jandaei TaxID=650 RepID=UPI001C03A913|nr:hypothetical protein [Aeromonas jandaei]QWL65229.1 hypothetical protein HQ398_02770 [Aeromonas jandaei]
MSSIVIDTCVMRLYNAPLDPKYMELFKWLTTSGELYVTQKLINEYLGTQNRNVSILLTQLLKNSEESSKKTYPRAVKLSKKDIESFSDDKRYNYTCNKEDVYHAKLVFLSPRKKLISQDKKIVSDVNNFKKVDGIKPEAEIKPEPIFYI